MDYIEDTYPLSPMQQGMLFHSLYSAQPGVYIQQIICALHEDLNISAFKQAWHRLVERHPVLRTCFRLKGLDEPLQEVHGHVTLPFEEQDWCGLSITEQEKRLRSYLQIDRCRGFELSKTPFMRLALFRLNEVDYRFIWTFHHILLDGRSFPIVLREIFAFYEAFRQGQDLQIEKPRPYKDYIDWLQKKDFSKAESFWRSTLNGFSAPTPLVVDRAYRSKYNKEVGFGKQGIRLSEALTSALQSLAQQHQLTLNTLVQGAWALLLSRYSGEKDVLFGATRACRRSALEGAESMVGLFINTLPVRVCVPPDRSLLSWLKELRAQWIIMREYEHTPLIMVQEWSDVPKGEALFENILVFEKYKLNSILQAQSGSWKKREFELLQQTNYPLILFGYLDTGLILGFSYDKGRFDDPLISRMLGHLKTLLKGMVANPNQQLSDLPLLTEAERRQLLVQWNDTQVDYPKDSCIHELFETQVERTSDAIAVVYENEQLTYRELNARSNQLAHYLRRLGVGPEVLVGICVERSLEMVVGLLGILKAGGAYVPLDPTYPKERLEFMLEDAQSPVLLTQERLIERVPKHGALIVCLDKDWVSISIESNANPARGVTANNLAYVIYTSGSTGKPKGVMICHRSICNRLFWGKSAYQMTEADRVLQKTSLSFDVSARELFEPLLVGGQLILVRSDRQQDIAYIVCLISEQKITAVTLPPSMLKVFLNEQGVEKCNSLRRVNTGGEVLHIELQERFFACLAADLYIGYGPTEATISVTNWVCKRGGNQYTVPIGRPIANTQVYILDEYLNPAPVGVLGELYIGGDGLSRGYLNQPRLTTERFIPNLFSDEPGARLYKTDDLARWRSDGNIEFLGRIDNQVKIRGFRIELGEIETVLDQHHGVKQVVVLAREDEPGNKRLVAYIVPEEDSKPSTSGLRDFLKQKLPEYMIPSAFIMLEFLPLTPNGKVDRKALPVPDQERPELSKEFVAPSTPLEIKLSEIWCILLKLKNVGVNDNFFELGGHSLLAIQLVSRIRDAFQVDIPLRKVFETPTVCALAESVTTALKTNRYLQASPIKPEQRKETMPLSFAQQRLWFLDQLTPGLSAYNMAFIRSFNGPLNIPVLEKCLNEVIKRHEILRTNFIAIDGQPAQKILQSVTFSLPIVDFSEWSESEREEQALRVMEEETERTFDLPCDLLIRAKLLIMEEQKYYFVLTIHHIVSDGWSINLFEKELSVLYRAFLNGEPSPLPEISVQYADFSVWQHHWLQGEVLEKQLSFWKKQLDKAPQSLELPTDWPRPVNQSLRSERCSLTIPKQLSKALNDLSTREGCTLFMTMLSAFKILLYRLSGQDDILVGTPVEGRNRIEVEGLIGFFINTLTLRSDLSGNPDFRKLLTQVREVTLDAYAHQDISFEKLVEELHPRRDLTRPPFFQVFINMFNVEAGQLNLPGLAVEPLSLDKVESKFDLTLYIREFNENIQLNLVYRTELFTKERMETLIRQYSFLLEQIVEEPGKQICNYSLVMPESLSLLPDPKEVISEPRQDLVSNMFFSWVRQTPKKTALTIDRHTWCYSELGECVENLAKVLVSMEVKRGDVVAIMGQKSFGLIVSISATMLSGGVILLIDSNLPEQRKQLMISDANAGRIIYVGEITSEDMWIDKIPEIDILNVETFTGKTVETEKYKRRKSISLPVVTPDDAAYIFFTSGTTGKPKGILGNHKGLSHFLAWQRDEYAVGPGDKVAQLTNLSFDVVLRDIFLPLTSGGTLCVPEHIQDTTPDRILSWLEYENITILHLVPSIANVWLDELPQGISLKNLRCVFFAGEPLSEELVMRWRDTFPDSGELVNLYGPTETTLAKCFYKVPQNIDAGIQSIGRPLPNTQALVFSKDNVLCGIGETGEIAIQTPFRSEGYINDKEENKSRFIKNPYRNDDDDLLYYTGDLGRYRPDGFLDILGRIDSQVKILGVRVELEEISVTLSKHPSVKSCVVIAGNNKDNQKYLIGYVVLSEGLMVSAHDIRLFLGRTLPAAMVPSFIIFLDSIPLTPNGKVDRKALPAPDQKRSEMNKEFVAPNTPTEIKLAEIWCRLLKPKEIGVHDNFFELGGHSLLATQLIWRIEDVFQVELPLRVVFEDPFIAEIAQKIEQIKANVEGDKELGPLLDELEGLSDEEAQRLLKED